MPSRASYVRTLAMRAPSCTTLTVILRVPSWCPDRVWQVPFLRASLWRGLYLPVQIPAHVYGFRLDPKSSTMYMPIKNLYRVQYVALAKFIVKGFTIFVCLAHYCRVCRVCVCGTHVSREARKKSQTLSAAVMIFGKLLGFGPLYFGRPK